MDSPTPNANDIVEDYNQFLAKNRVLNPHVSVECVVFGFDGEKLKVLLVEQGQPLNGEENEKRVRLALPGDLIYDDESLHNAAGRILKDLTRLDNIFLKQFRAFGKPQRYQHDKDYEWLQKYRSSPDARVVSIAYYALVQTSDYETSPVTNTIWLETEALPQLAFDHNHITGKALSAIRADIFNPRIPMNLLPEKFTLRQLQKVYEAILGKELDKRNFRKTVKKMDHIKPLDEKESGVQHKRAQYFKVSISELHLKGIKSF